MAARGNVVLCGLDCVSRFKAIDRLRRRARREAVSGEVADTVHLSSVEDRTLIEDDRLDLIFICCERSVTGRFLASPILTRSRFTRVCPHETNQGSRLPGGANSVLHGRLEALGVQLLDRSPDAFVQGLAPLD